MESSRPNVDCKCVLINNNQYMIEKDITDEEWIKDYGCDIDHNGHAWGLGWEESDKIHPGFGTYGGYAQQCFKCGMYSHEYFKINENPVEYENQKCGLKIRKV